MSNIDKEKKQIYDLLFYDWTPNATSRVKPEVMDIIKASFDHREKQTMALAELHFNIQHATRNLLDYIELSLEEVDLKYASKIARKFVLKALSLGPFWEHLKEMGIIPEDTMSEWC